MKCISKRKLLCCCVSIAAIFISGCSAGSTELNEAYDVYGTGKTVGISTTTADEVSYFAKDLCVSEDINLGTEDTTSEVAEGAGVFNLATNTVTYSKNLYEKLYPASTTKILTAYIALKYCDLNEMVTVSENAVNQTTDSSICNLNAGDVISMRYLLYGLMLRSGNDAAIAIAEHISGDVDSFAVLMNQEAKALGATNSNFVNPNGLPDENHYTTIYDMYLIFQAALQNETFVTIISTVSTDVTYYNRSGEAVSQSWSNTNQYLLGKQTAPDGITIVGGKTGTTGEAGYCLVLYSYNSENQPIISIVFKADCKSNLYLLMNEMLAGYTN
ncbi:MAG: D-alanyl-D-alanine carboxypeptidase family protein [Roseburia sp.]